MALFKIDQSVSFRRLQLVVLKSRGWLESAPNISISQLEPLVPIALSTHGYKLVLDHTHTHSIIGNNAQKEISTLLPGLDH